jgi:hypothetical protein
MELLPVLRNEAPYGAVRVSQLELTSKGEDRDADVLALAAAVAAHESLKSLSLVDIRFARGLNAMVEAAERRGLCGLQIRDCVLDAESAPALARLLQRGSLTKLCIITHDFPHADEASVPVLCAALRACRTLRDLVLYVAPIGASRRLVTELLDAVAALPALSTLELWGRLRDREAAGRAFGALLGANRPNLCALDVTFCDLGEEGMKSLLDGLAANEHALAHAELPNWQRPERRVPAQPAGARAGGAGRAPRAR